MTLSYAFLIWTGYINILPKCNYIKEQRRSMVQRNTLAK